MIILTKLVSKKFSLIISSVILILISIFIVHMLIFFYLFDDNIIKALINKNFISSQYIVKFDGKIKPQFWHGLSISIANTHILNKITGTDVVTIKNFNCQFSWYQFLFNNYQIKKIAITNITLQKNVLLQYMMDKSGSIYLFQILNNINAITVSNINILDADNTYQLQSGNIELKHNNSLFNLKINFLLNSLNNLNIILNSQFHFVNQELINFDIFKINGLNNNFNTHLGANANYMTQSNTLLLQDITGDIQLGNNIGNINIANIELTPSNSKLNNLNMYIDVAKNNIHSKLSLKIATLNGLQYQTWRAHNSLIEYRTTLLSTKINVYAQLQNTLLNEEHILSSNTCAANINVYTPYLQESMQNIMLNGSCKYNHTQQLWNFDIDGSLNKELLKFNVVLNTKDKPSLSINGLMNNLNLSRLNNKNQALLDTNDKLPFSWLSFINTNANLSIKHFIANKIILNNLTTNFIIKNNNLYVSKLSTDIYNGKLDGSLIIKTNPSSYDITLKEVIKNINIQDILNDYFNIKAINGNGNIQLNVTIESINTYDDIQKNLNGSILIWAKKGFFDGVDLNFFGKNESTVNLLSNKSTIFNNMYADFYFKNGVSNNSNINFQSPYVFAKGRGKINFVDNVLDYNLNIKSTLPNNKQKFNTVIIPLKINGDILNPNINIEHVHLTNTNIIKKAHKKPHKSSKKHKHIAN